jgi:hypothetical protein
VTCNGDGGSGGGDEEIEMEISFSEVLLLNESAKQQVVLQGDLCADYERQRAGQAECAV